MRTSLVLFLYHFPCEFWLRIAQPFFYDLPLADGHPVI